MFKIFKKKNNTEKDALTRLLYYTPSREQKKVMMKAIDKSIDEQRKVMRRAGMLEPIK